MLLSGVLFILFLAGCWLYCLADAALMPAEAFPGWRKRTWIVVISVTLIAGAIAWMIARRNWRSQHWRSADAANLMIIDRSGPNVVWYPHPPTEPSNPSNPSAPTDPAHPTEIAADAALSRHPSGRRGRSGGTAANGPDDDPEFLRQLAQRIHGSPTDPAE
jgi:hypothetical protein